jgi:hypothetical protein
MDESEATQRKKKKKKKGKEKKERKSGISFLFLNPTVILSETQSFSVIK